MLSIRHAIAIGVGTGVGLIVLLSAAAWAAGGFPSLRRDSEFTSATLFELLKLVFAVVGGIGGVVGLVMLYRKQRIAEAADERSHAAKLLADIADARAALAAERDVVRLFNERFAKAAEQLGSDKAAIRLSGVYAMAGLADDWTHGRQTCIEVLCAYLRLPYTTPDGEGEEQDKARAERQVRYTVIRILRDRLRPDAKVSWQGHDLNFTGATFDGGDFSGAEFSAGDVTFRACRFVAGVVDFTRTRFTGARVSFLEATFSGSEVWFQGSEFDSGVVDFSLTKVLEGTLDFTDANLSGGELRWEHARIESLVAFRRTEFEGGKLNLEHATITGMLDFDQAAVHGTEMRLSRIVITEQGGLFFNRCTDVHARLDLKALNLEDGRLVFRECVLETQIDFFDARLMGGRVEFLRSTVGEVLFTSTRLQGARLSFEDSQIRGPLDFSRAVLNSGALSFAGARFDGGQATFHAARVGQVELRAEENSKLDLSGALLTPAVLSQLRERKLPGVLLP